MTKAILAFLFSVTSLGLFGQSVDDPLSLKKMNQDFEVFKEIRIKANSGLYKYRTKQEIDSLYDWAEREIREASTYLDFYNIICAVTDFEGSCHNSTYLAARYRSSLRRESSGYFPYPIKWIEGTWRINFDKGDIPLGAEIITINQVPISDIVQNLYKYYSTDGSNTTGKRIGLRGHFAKYYRWHYGLTGAFEVEYRIPSSNHLKTRRVESIGYADYYRNVNARYSRPYDQIYYANLKEDQKYGYEQMDHSTGVLTIHTFSMGNEAAEEHKDYSKFLDSVFLDISSNAITDLIVDVRQNHGGTDPNDLLTFSYLAQRRFQENTEAWISFDKIPLIRHIDFWLPKFLRPLFVGKYNRAFQKEFPLHQDGKFYQDENSQDHKIRLPNKNAFSGKVYLLVSPAVASAGSLFAAMVAGQSNTTTIGEETMGGYYGHNGHTPLTYILPGSKIEITFSVVNLEQDVPMKSNQYDDRGIIPDIVVSQTYEDFLKHRDTQMEYARALIARKDQ